MKYYEVDFRIEAPSELLQTAGELLASIAVEAGFESFEDTADDTGHGDRHLTQAWVNVPVPMTHRDLTGYVQQQLFSRDTLDALIADFPLPQCTITYDVHEADYRDWNEQWEQQGFEPIVIPFTQPGKGELIIHDGRHLPQTDITMAIEIHARQAFGTGTHETTRMMVATLMSLPLHDMRVLDCGTGTGILSIAALKLGAREAVGYDIDEWSVDNALHNAAVNHVADRFTSLLGDAGILAGTHEGTPYEALDGLFDIVLANIHRNIILADMPAMVAKMKPGAFFAISGFLTHEAEMLQSRAAEHGLSLLGSKEDNGWICLLFNFTRNLAVRHP